MGEAQLPPHRAPAARARKDEEPADEAAAPAPTGSVDDAAAAFRVVLASQ